MSRRRVSSAWLGPELTPRTISPRGVARPRLGGTILAQVRSVRSRIPLRPTDSVKDLLSHPRAPRPAGSVALDFTCETHGVRLMRLWMSPRTGDATFGGEGVRGAWDIDPRGCGAVVVRCLRHECRSSARLTNDWLVDSLRRVRAEFEAGRGLPIASFPLSQVGEQA
jgi:hypothetical protein